MKECINTPNAPDPLGPYNQAIKSGHMLFVSGQVAIDPSSGDLIIDDLEKEAHQVMKNIGAILEEAGLTYNHIVKTSIFLKNMAHFSTINSIYGGYFKDNYPARETVEVSRLPKDVNVEISVIAVES